MAAASRPCASSLRIVPAHLGAHPEIGVDVSGQKLVSVITKHSAQDLKRAAGDDITVIIKSKSTEVMIGK